MVVRARDLQNKKSPIISNLCPLGSRACIQKTDGVTIFAATATESLEKANSISQRPVGGTSLITAHLKSIRIDFTHHRRSKFSKR